MRRVAFTLLVAAAALAACSDDGDEDAGGAGREDVTTTTTVASQPPGVSTGRAPASEFTLLELQPGDAACYLRVKNAAGAEESLPGTFELCPGGSADATPSVGRRVTLERRPDQILADS
jgi:hypothetical protein